jgi:hypothetical protein
VPSIVNGQLVQGDGTAAEQIPDFWRVGTGATGALPDGTTDVTDVIAHQSDIFVGLDALMRVGHGAANIATNTAVGNLSLNSNTTGGSNTAIGISSLNANTTGSFNTAVGRLSLGLNLSGSSNTAIGQSSLGLNTTGTSNTAVGTNALRSNTIGGSNTSIGESSLFSNTTGLGNTSSGIASLRSNTTGNGNTASGEGSLYSNTTGISNTASGINSLRASTIGSNNTSVGNAALYYNQENSNTAIGAQAFNNFNTLLSSATMTASSATQVTLSSPMTPSPLVGSLITFINIGGYANTISGLLLAKSYKVVNDTTLEVVDTSQVLGTTGTATGFEIRQSKGYSNSTGAGFESEPYSSNQVALGNQLVTTTVFGDKIAFDLVAINAAPIGTTLKITGTTTGGHGGTVKIIGV